MSSDLISSVQFVRFRLGGIDAEQFLRVADERRISIEVDHPKPKAVASIEPPLTRALAGDLAA